MSQIKIIFNKSITTDVDHGHSAIEIKYGNIDSVYSYGDLHGGSLSVFENAKKYYDYRADSRQDISIYTLDCSDENAAKIRDNLLINVGVKNTGEISDYYYQYDSSDPRAKYNILTNNCTTVVVNAITNANPSILGNINGIAGANWMPWRLEEYLNGQLELTNNIDGYKYIDNGQQEESLMDEITRNIESNWIDNYSKLLKNSTTRNNPSGSSPGSTGDNSGSSGGQGSPNGGSSSSSGGLGSPYIPGPMGTGGFSGPNPFMPLSNSLFPNPLELIKALASPIILDLNADGISTLTQTNGSLFDLDNTGFLKNTGWVNPNDGLLVLDRNNDGIINNGSELFGDHTQLQSGKNAANGFIALAEYDNTHDGKIDSSDSFYTKLKIWQDKNSDGFSSESELFSLSALGIQALNINYTVSHNTDSNGNIEIAAGSFTKSDGSRSKMSDYNFVMDTVHTIAIDWQNLSSNIINKPYLPGYGKVHDLWQALTRDSNGSIDSALTAFTNTDFFTRQQALDNLLWAWTGSQNITSDSRGPYIDGRVLHTLEQFYGQDFYQNNLRANPGYNASAALDHLYQQVKTYFYAQLATQTTYSPIFSNVNIIVTADNKSYIADFTALIQYVDNKLNNNYVDGLTTLADLNNVWQGLGLSSKISNYSDFTNHYSQQNNYLFNRILNSTLIVGSGIDSNNNPLVMNTNLHKVLGDSNNNIIIANNFDCTINGYEGDDYFIARIPEQLYR